MSLIARYLRAKRQLAECEREAVALERGNPVDFVAARGARARREMAWIGLRDASVQLCDALCREYGVDGDDVDPDNLAASLEASGRMVRRAKGEAPPPRVEPAWTQERADRVLGRIQDAIRKGDR